MRRLQVVLFYICIVFFLLIVSKLGESLHLPAFQTKDTLLEEIKANVEKYEEPPQDAYIDRVWKKTPGRNGIQVDVDKSYEKMKKSKVFNESLLVFEQIQPEISLADLEPAPIFRGHPEKKKIGRAHV